MKRIMLTLITLLLLSALIQPASALKIGDAVGQVLYTDIVAKIDGHPIRAYNVAGHMCVVAEELRAYGFDVTWFGDERLLTVDPSKTVNPAAFPEYVPEPPKGQIGAPAFPILYTDIVTYVDGRPVESYNIDGQTVIYFQDLRKCGFVHYDNAVRTTSFTHTDPWNVSLSKTDFPRNANGISLAAVVRRNGGKPVLTLASDPGGQFELTVSERTLRLAHYTYGIPEGDPYYDMDFYKSFLALTSMGLPDAAENYLHYDNTDEQKAAVSAYLRVTLNGEPVKGDCYLSWGNGHADVNFDYDKLIPLKAGDLLLVEIGSEGLFAAGGAGADGQPMPGTAEEELEALRQRVLFHETATVENELCWVLLGEFRGTTRGTQTTLDVVYKSGGTKSLYNPVCLSFQAIDSIEFSSDPKILIVKGRVLSADRQTLLPSTLEVNIYTGETVKG